jgi:tetratricopeptide (TPR) repeat protein
MGYLSYIAPARDQLFKARNAKQAEILLQPFVQNPPVNPCEKRAVFELMALIFREQKRFEDAYTLYEAIDDSYQAGYCALLLGNIPMVQHQWGRTLQSRGNHWCISLYGMVTQQLRTYPTLFQIRNQLESDIANLIAANQTEFVRNLLRHVDLLAQLNLESPKFAGRALMHAGWLEEAGKFLVQGQKLLPNDPEIYFHLAQFSSLQHHYQEARLMLKQCLLISPSYTPAKELMQQLPQSA